MSVGANHGSWLRQCRTRTCDVHTKNHIREHAENVRNFSNNSWLKVFSGLLRLTVTCDQIVLCHFRSLWCFVQTAMHVAVSAWFCILPPCNMNSWMMHLNVCFTTSGWIFRHPMEPPKVQAQLEEVQVEQFLDGSLQTKLLSPSGEISDNLHSKGWNQPNMQNPPTNIPISQWFSLYISFSTLDASASVGFSADLLPR